MKVVKYVPIYYVLVPLTAVKWMTTKNYCFFWPVVFFQVDTWLLCSFLFLTSNLQHNLPYFSIHCIPHIAKLICEFAHESGEYSDIYSLNSYLCAGCHHLQYKCLYRKESGKLPIPFYSEEYRFDNGKLLNFLQ